MTTAGQRVQHTCDKFVRWFFLAALYGGLLLVGLIMLAFSFLGLAHPEPVSSLQEYERAHRWGVAWFFIAMVWFSGVIWLYLFLKRHSRLHVRRD